MKQFSLEEFKKNPSHKVVTRDGRPVRILCTDAKGDCPVFALATYNGIEFPLMCSEIGEGDFEKDDLFFVIENKEGWINIYPEDDICDTKEEALRCRANILNVRTIKITWEE